MYKLLLKTDKNIQSKIELFEYDVINKKDLLINGFVFEDQNYSIELIGNLDNIKNAEIYINDSKVNSLYKSGRFEMLDDERKLFNTCFGFVYITIEIVYLNDEREIFYSNYISVFMKEGFASDRINKMYGYIFDNERDLLYQQDKAIITASLNHSNNKNSIDSKISLAEDIVRFYENNFGYFKSNCRFKVNNSYAVDNIEKLNKFDSRTIEYILQHPEQLKKSYTEGININGSKYYPQKTLMQINDITTDIYENQVVVAFIKKMIIDLKEIVTKLEALMNKMPKVYEGEFYGYTHSAEFIIKDNRDRFTNQLDRVNKCIRNLESLYMLYKKNMEVSIIDMNIPPKPTAIMISIPQYNKLFSSICKWYEFGEYDIAEDVFMLSPNNIFTIYELFVLCRLINSLKNSGYEIKESKKINYRMHSKARYIQSDCNNSFLFENKEEDEIIYLYYQPVIYRGGDRNGHIGLFRNTSLSFDSSNQGGYYTPDYIIKRVKGNNVTFDILDAKYKNKESVKSEIPKLVYKYLFSLSTINEEDKIKGMYILYGLASKLEYIESIYNYQKDRKILPRVELIPVTAENTNVNLTEALLTYDT